MKEQETISHYKTENDFCVKCRDLEQSWTDYDKRYKLHFISNILNF